MLTQRGEGASLRSHSPVTSVRVSPSGQDLPAPTPSHLDRPGSRIQAHVGTGIQGRAHMGGQEVLSSLHREEGNPGDLKEPS